jgi:hypothetical protein
MAPPAAILKIIFEEGSMEKTDSDFSLVEFVPCTRLNSPRCATLDSASK